MNLIDFFSYLYIEMEKFGVPTAQSREYLTENSDSNESTVENTSRKNAKAQLIAKKLAPTLASVINEGNKSDIYQVYLALERFMNKNQIRNQEICSELGISASELSKFKKNAIGGYKKRSINTAKIIKNFLIEHDESAINIKNEEMISYLENRLDVKSLSIAEKNNLCGDYFFIHRSNYKINEARVLKISKLRLYCSAEGTLKFIFMLRNSDSVTSIVRGIALRSNEITLSLIGFSYLNGKAQSIQKISLSLHSSTSGVKKYINGSYIGNEDDTKKPYSTWVHFSKIPKALEPKIKEFFPVENIDIGNEKYENFFLSLDFGSLNYKNDKVLKLKKFIVDNYPDHHDFEQVVKYIVGKLYLESPDTHVM
ncbi:hypothetical protein EXT47_13900 [Pseudoalteromonas sp. CO342X]|uniref:hypothetical protein n=1 Tax=Pseudoalteromonas sp. CO342X TaxID=1777270 RepID=UPI001023F02F|nr:hypothetical protein [Pseudoalteromonas sp. CO342X]RZG14358.1 hypothetical protein EXT47_13900 [Pseudoalteromonas sp. CO342X]